MIKLTSANDFIISIAETIILSFESKKDRIEIEKIQSLKTNLKNYWSLIVNTFFKVFFIERFSKSDLTSDTKKPFLDMAFSFLELSLLHGPKEMKNFLNSLKCLAKKCSNLE